MALRTEGVSQSSYSCLITYIHVSCGDNGGRVTRKFSSITNRTFTYQCPRTWESLTPPMCGKRADPNGKLNWD